MFDLLLGVLLQTHSKQLRP